MAENETDFKLKFDGQLNELDASTLGYSLVNFTSIVREAGAELATGQAIEIKVKATAPGSFLVHLSLETAALSVLGIVGAEGLAQAAKLGTEIIKTVAELFKLRKTLKGEPPKEIVQKDDEYHITANDNVQVKIEKNTYNLYFNNQKVNEALAKTFRTLESDRSVEGFEIADSDEQPLFEASREDFAGMALTTSVPQIQERDAIERAHVYVVKASFDPKLKWEVLYKGNRTPVWLRDTEFQNRIERGERFGKGDVLVVDLKVHQKLDPALGAYVNKSHEILKVLEHIPREEQNSLFDYQPIRMALPSSGRKFGFGGDDEAEEQDKPESEPKPKLLS